MNALALQENLDAMARLERALDEAMRTMRVEEGAATFDVRLLRQDAERLRLVLAVLRQMMTPTPGP